ncbi:MAG: acyl carrier protein [Nitrospira sp.]|nr:acyl carrier protein [Nitrospira sp.]MDH4250236.1 acyl carrier protein [Nitrospira sp.]MDH4342339.1 acyl carrier protein [Nitrospira sp.]MDH5335508.1 acyl carrier protein [Nitrospira sp.]
MTERIDPAVTAKIIQALASYLKRDPASITEAHHLRDDLGLDSVAIIELLFEIEERFKLQIPDQDLPGLSTVGTVAAYVQQRLAESKTESKPASPKPVAAASKSKAAKLTKTKSTKTTSDKSPSTKKAAAAKSVMASKSKKISSGKSGKKKVTAR